MSRINVRSQSTGWQNVYIALIHSAIAKLDVLIADAEGLELQEQVRGSLRLITPVLCPMQKGIAEKRETCWRDVQLIAVFSLYGFSMIAMCAMFSSENQINVSVAAISVGLFVVATGLLMWRQGMRVRRLHSRANLKPLHQNMYDYLLGAINAYKHNMGSFVEFSFGDVDVFARHDYQSVLTYLQKSRIFLQAYLAKPAAGRDTVVLVTLSQINSDLDCYISKNNKPIIHDRIGCLPSIDEETAFNPLHV